MFYKNISYSVKTFYGVTFRPGETKEVGNYINDKLMILSDAPVNKTVIAQQKPSDKSKKNVPKSVTSEPKVDIVKSEDPKVENPKTEETNTADSENKGDSKVNDKEQKA